MATTALSCADLDPYLAWAQTTGFAAVLQRPKGLLRVAFQFRDDRQRARFAAQFLALGVGLAPHYIEAVQRKGCRFVCADVPPDALPLAAALASRIKVGLIGNAEQLPLQDGERVARGDLNSPLMKPKAVRRLRRALAGGGGGRVDGLRDIAKVKTSGTKAGPAHQTKDVAPSTAPMIAVIDFGCAFAHPCFQRDGGTRIRHFWDQGRGVEAGWQHELAPAWPWRTQPEFGYGREADCERLNALMAGVRNGATPKAGTPTAAGFEEACYLAAALPELLEPWSHGTAVLGMAAAESPPWLSGAPAPDEAAKADLIFVQLPEAAIEDLSGGWVTTYVLDALEYAMAKAGDRPLVVNISIGSHGGPHDGGSLLEAAIEYFMKNRHGLHVVLAAGNAADKRGHAVAQIPAERQGELRWVVPDRDPTQSFLEFWYPRANPGEQPQFTVRRLSGGPCLSAPGEVARDAAGVPCAALWQLPTSTAGGNSGMTLFALAPTMARQGATNSGIGVAPAGAWIIDVYNPSKQPIEVHAWIERDEPGAGPLSDRPDSVLVAPKDGAFKVTDATTLTGQATGTAPWVVGGYELFRPRATNPPEPMVESGRGPARRSAKSKPRVQPDALAPADRWQAGATRGLKVLANRSPLPGQSLLDIDSEGFAALRGTSLSAPWVARQLYNLLAADAALDSKDKLKKCLQAKQADIAPPIFLT
ncbi:S8 family serine peptidase [Ideonella sp.]|uniref:S8 family serine peptidase n=1 Tax=Ideonella sp. TaxID=1929293 RepID=UPI0035B373CA